MNIIQERPYFNEAYLVLMDLLIQEKRYPEAIVWAKKLIQQLPSEVKAYTLLGLAYAQTGNATSAIETWEKALALDPNLQNIKLNLSSLYIQQRQFDKAEKLLLELKGKVPSLESNVLLNLASLYFAQERWNESLEYLKQLEQLQPQNYFVKEQMAFVYYQLGDITRAKELLQSCQKANHPLNPQLLNLINQNP